MGDKGNSGAELSRRMSTIRTKGTAPETSVRKALRRLGVMAKTNASHLPGSPDLLVSQEGAAIFVHGCFWHRHRGCRYAYMPKSNVPFWTAKFEANVRRDIRVARRLRRLGWRVLTVWECQTWDPAALERLLHGRLRLSP